MRNMHGVYPKPTADELKAAFNSLEQRQYGEHRRRRRGADGFLTSRLDLRMQEKRLREHMAAAGC